MSNIAQKDLKPLPEKNLEEAKRIITSYELSLLGIKKRIEDLKKQDQRRSIKSVDNIKRGGGHER